MVCRLQTFEFRQLAELNHLKPTHILHEAVYTLNSLGFEPITLSHNACVT